MAASMNASEIPIRSSRLTAFIRRRAMTTGSRSCAATMTIGAVSAPRWKVKSSRATRAMRPRRDAASIARLSTRQSAPGAAPIDRGEIEARLQSHGVPAHQVQNSADAYADPQFTHRRPLRRARSSKPRQIHGRRSAREALANPGLVRRAAPSLGQDNQHVLENILGYDETRISELAASGALG